MSLNTSFWCLGISSVQTEIEKYFFLRVKKKYLKCSSLKWVNLQRHKDYFMCLERKFICVVLIKVTDCAAAIGEYISTETSRFLYNRV